MNCDARLLLTCCLVTAATVCHADDSEAAAEAAKASFTPVTDADVAAARAELAERVIAAERMLQPETAQGAGWLEYLAWSGIQQQLADGSAIDLAAARETLRRLSSGAEGLERPELQRAGDAIAAYVGVAQFARAPGEQQRRVFESDVDRLVTSLGDPAGPRLGSEAFKDSRALARLAGIAPTGRGDAFLDQVRDHFGRPNLLVEVQTELLNQAASRPINDCGPLEDCILGTRIRGTGATTALVRLSTIPSADRARLALHLTGSTRSRTTGVNGPVRIRSLGNTTFSATKIVEVTDKAFRVLPASASATTQSQTQGVQKIGGGIGSRLIESIARKRVAESKRKADAIASGRARDRVAQRLNAQVDGELAKARRRYDEAFTWPLRRRRATPRSLLQSTTSDSLLVTAVQAGPAQLAASTAPPLAVAAPLSAQVHETALANLIDDVLGGATFRQQEHGKPPRTDIVKPDWLKLESPAVPVEDFKPWRLKLRGRKPVSVSLRDGVARVVVHVAEFQSGNETFRGWDIVAVYRPELIDERWRMVRVGDVEVLLTGEDPNAPRRRRQSETFLAQRSVLAGRLNQEKGGLPPVIDIDPIDLSSRGGPIRELAVVGLQIRDGWLAAGWRAP